MYRFIIGPMVLATVLQFAGATVEASNEIYDRVKQSTVWIVTNDGYGTGVLIDADQRLVATNAHVVEGDDEPLVYAPAYDDGEIWDRDSYLDQTLRLHEHGFATLGQVVAVSDMKDLAIIQLMDELTGLQEIKFADTDPSVHEGLHIVGNPADRPLFTYSYGGTESVEWFQGEVDGDAFEARVINFSGHVWPGNSGGPVANSEGELVGVLSAGDPTSGMAVHLDELEWLLDTISSQQIFSVTNETSIRVYFSTRLDEDQEWEAYELEPGHYRIWWPDNVGQVKIKFDHSFVADYQGREYRLETDQSLVGHGYTPEPGVGVSYGFRGETGGINLFNIS